MVHSTVPPCDMLPPAVDGAERVEQAEHLELWFQGADGTLTPAMPLRWTR